MKLTRLVTPVLTFFATLCILCLVANQPKTVLAQGGGWVAGSLMIAPAGAWRRTALRS